MDLHGVLLETTIVRGEETDLLVDTAADLLLGTALETRVATGGNVEVHRVAMVAAVVLARDLPVVVTALEAPLVGMMIVMEESVEMMTTESAMVEVPRPEVPLR